MPTATRQEFTALFNNAAIGIITVNSEGSMVLVNQFALDKFGYTEEELVGKKIEVLLPTRYQQRHLHHRNNYHHHNPHSRPMGLGMDLFAVKKDGTEFPVEVSLSSYKTDAGQFSIAFISDITIRKASEDALVQLNAALEEKVRDRTQSLSEALKKEKELNELKSRFVSMASHEFRTPLSTILSSAYLISKYETSEEQPKRDRHIQRIASSVNMLTDILNDFLSVGKMEEGKIQVRMQHADIKKILEDLASELHTILKPGQELVYVHEGDTMAYLDPSLMKHILMNLVSNAIKFSRDNGSIYIRTEMTTEEFLLSVTDNGIGISAEDQQHLFERFFRGANVVNIQGTGLGLHIVAKYAELMNGTISFTSELEKGTTFTLSFKTTNETT